MEGEGEPGGAAARSELVRSVKVLGLGLGLGVP